MAQPRKKVPYSPAEEICNAITHGTGALISIAGLFFLIIHSGTYGQAGHIAGSAVFGLSLVLLYTASTLYHSFQKTEIKRVLRVIDHCFIYVLIAGTYTPFMLLVVRGTLGWIIFALVLSLSVFSIVFKTFFIDRFKVISTLAYIGIGWLVVFAAGPLFQALPGRGIAWLVTGGLAYTLGTIFYAWRTLPFNHAVWHLFVLCGSICQFMAVFFYVIPAKA